MENKDFLMRQVESLDIIIKKIFSKISTSNENQISEIDISEINNSLKLITGFDLKEIATINEEEFLTGLIERNIIESDISNLVNIFNFIANADNADALGLDAANLVRKALFIEDYMIKSRKTAFFVNVNQIDKARNLTTKKTKR